MLKVVLSGCVCENKREKNIEKEKLLNRKKKKISSTSFSQYIFGVVRELCHVEVF
jgi:hypothetical protein